MVASGQVIRSSCLTGWSRVVNWSGQWSSVWLDGHAWSSEVVKLSDWGLSSLHTSIYDTDEETYRSMSLTVVTMTIFLLSVLLPICFNRRRWCGSVWRLYITNHIKLLSGYSITDLHTVKRVLFDLFRTISCFFVELLCRPRHRRKLYAWHSICLSVCRPSVPPSVPPSVCMCV